MIGVFWSLLFGAVAVVGISGNIEWVVNGATHWIVAGVIALGGLILLFSALPSRSRD